MRKIASSKPISRIMSHVNTSGFHLVALTQSLSVPTLIVHTMRVHTKYRSRDQLLPSRDQVTRTVAPLYAVPYWVTVAVYRFKSCQPVIMIYTPIIFRFHFPDLRYQDVCSDFECFPGPYRTQQCTYSAILLSYWVHCDERSRHLSLNQCTLSAMGNNKFEI